MKAFALMERLFYFVVVTRVLDKYKQVSYELNEICCDDEDVGIHDVANDGGDVGW